MPILADFCRFLTYTLSSRGPSESIPVVKAVVCGLTTKQTRGIIAVRAHLLPNGRAVALGACRELVVFIMAYVWAGHTEHVVENGIPSLPLVAGRAAGRAAAPLTQEAADAGALAMC